MSPSLSLLLADIVLMTHFAFVAFVVAGLLLILAGGPLKWRWVRNRWFRRAHLAAIAVVVLQAWLGVACPLTLLEASLRANAGQASYSGAFIAQWVSRLLYYDLPLWVFTLAYTVFGLLVAATWYWIAPRPAGAPDPTVTSTAYVERQDLRRDPPVEDTHPANGDR